MLDYSIIATKEWIDNNHMFKTPLLKYLKIYMDLSVASSLHDIKITADKDLEKSLSP